MGKYFEFTVVLLKFILIVLFVFCLTLICTNGNTCLFIKNFIIYFKSLVTNVVEFSLQTGILFMVFLYSINEIYKVLIESLKNNIWGLYRESILKEYVLSDDELLSRLNRHCPIYAEDKQYGIYVKISIKDVNTGMVEYIDSGNIVEFRFSDIYNEIKNLCIQKGLICYNDEALSVMYSKGFRFQKVS